MSDPAIASSGAIAACVGLSALALFIWLWHLALLSDLSGSDAAGNGMTQGFAGLAMIVLWVLLAIFMLIVVAKGGVPNLAALAALILIPASGFAAAAALQLLIRRSQMPFLWPIVTPALVPPLIIAFCFWALIPSLRAAIPAGVASGSVWGAILLLSLAILPMQYLRDRVQAQDQAEQDRIQAEFDRLPADAPLWDVLPLASRGNYSVAQAALDRARHLDRRQSDAELMLERGDFPLGQLRTLDLEPTPILCERARALLRRQVEPLVLAVPQSKPYSAVAGPVAGAADAIEWLVGRDCSCDAEALAWETMAKGYRGSDWDIYRLAEARDPKNLGRVLRLYPDKFSQLTPKAHLRAWLKFADETEYHDQALAGARLLDQRTDDAVEMLGEEFGAWTVLRYLPELDLEASPAFCDAARGVLLDKIDKVYRPKPDDPRSYDELLSRLGESSLTGLIWLARHGCDVEDELTDAEDLLKAYQDSPDRAAMLSTLAQLHRKP